MKEEKRAASASPKYISLRKKISYFFPYHRGGRKEMPFPKMTEEREEEKADGWEKVGKERDDHVSSKRQRDSAFCGGGGIPIDTDREESPFRLRASRE